jgi:hypothetical protein
MTREVVRSGGPLQVETPIGAPTDRRAAGELLVFVVLVIVLAGIWACLWVPPAWAP